MIHVIAAATVAAYVAFTSAGAPAIDYHDVFVDKQTGYAFVETTKGWKFIKKFELTQIDALPSGLVR